MGANGSQVVAVALHGPHPAVMSWPIHSETLGKCGKVKNIQLLFGGSESLPIFGEPKQKNMTQAKFKPGNHIFYRNLDGGNDPHVVLEVRHRGVSRGGWWVRIDDGRWVKSKNCQLQEEWRKENDQ